MRLPALTALLLLSAPLLSQDDAPKVAVGKAAPVFAANDHDGKRASIGRAGKTWTVLAFYPKAATPG